MNRNNTHVVSLIGILRFIRDNTDSTGWAFIGPRLFDGIRDRIPDEYIDVKCNLPHGYEVRLTVHGLAATERTRK